MTPSTGCWSRPSGGWTSCLTNGCLGEPSFQRVRSGGKREAAPTIRGRRCGDTAGPPSRPRLQGRTGGRLQVPDLWSPLLLFGGLPFGHFLALLAGFGETYGDGLLTVFTEPPVPPLPRLSFPDFRRFSARFTSFEALFEYRAMLPPSKSCRSWSVRCILNSVSVVVVGVRFGHILR